MVSDQSRYLATLERLLAINATSVKPALNEASDLIADALHADKVDAFVYEQATHTLVALGTSETPMARQERALGLDRLPVANDGRSVQVYQTGVVFQHSQLDTDLEELVGIRESLGVRSVIAVPLIVDGVRRGVMQVDSARAAAFTEEDRAFLISATNWVGLVFHRSELIEQLTRGSQQHARQLAAEEMVTVLAHDLRNYLAPLMSKVEIIQRRAERDGHTLYVEETTGVAQRLRRLSDSLTELLDVARLERGLFSLDRQSADLVPMVRETIAAVESGTQTIRLRAPQKLICSVDVKRIRQALENLIANAVRHAPGSEVAIEIRPELRKNADMVAIEVQDRGPGISPELLPRITDPFVRGSAGRGLGIGLYLVRGIVEAHGGTLEVSSVLGVGSNFKLIFPAAATEAG
jgi:two-component system, OmpR family, sensor kinase